MARIMLNTYSRKSCRIMNVMNKPLTRTKHNENAVRAVLARSTTTKYRARYIRMMRQYSDRRSKTSMRLNLVKCKNVAVRD